MDSLRKPMPSGKMRRSKSGCLIVLVTQAVAEQQYAPARTTAALMFFPVVPRALKNLPPSNPSKYTKTYTDIRR